MPIALEKSKLILKSFLDVIFPPACYVCGRSASSEYGLCETCLGQITPILPPFCPKCGKHIENGMHVCRECTLLKSRVERAWSSSSYTDTIKHCIHLFKYKGYTGLADILSDTMATFIRKNRIENIADIITAVPMHPSKKRERPYNHAEILARGLSRKFAIPVDCKNLKKIRWTSSQSELDREKRLQNVRDSFAVTDRNAFSGKGVLLVDDVYTTGATINECAKSLLGAGANKVYSLTLAR